MSNTKEKIGLIATKISFNQHSIIYNVKLSKEVESGLYGIFCADSIKNKDLILKPTIYINDKSEVVFCPSNVTPHFYQSILNGTLANIKEYSVELNQIYKVGEVVGYILI